MHRSHAPHIDMHPISMPACAIPGIAVKITEPQWVHTQRSWWYSSMCGAVRNAVHMSIAEAMRGEKLPCRSSDAEMSARAPTASRTATVRSPSQSSIPAVYIAPCSSSHTPSSGRSACTSVMPSTIQLFICA
jgi:hypothetical protein